MRSVRVEKAGVVVDMYDFIKVKLGGEIRTGGVGFVENEDG